MRIERPRCIAVGEVLRYPRSNERYTVSLSPNERNFFEVTFSKGFSGQAQMERGITPLKEVKGENGSWTPATMIRSSWVKAGTSKAPWHDEYDERSGRVRYFGDAKLQHMPHPAMAPGNKHLINQFNLYRSQDKEARENASPLLFFVSTKVGYVRFCGFGLIESVDLVSQIDPETGIAFSNYAYDCALLSLDQEGELFDWGWVSARRDRNTGVKESLKLAPQSWRKWVEEGDRSISGVRRELAKAGVKTKGEQLPLPGSIEEEVLNEVYQFYSDEGNRRKHRFEAMAEAVANHLIANGGQSYRPGWITRGVGDHGVDFVGRIDIGGAHSKMSLVVLGQAKCESPSAPTNGKDIARTVARLKRGWIGCYVTTSFFSRSSLEEVAEDQYPIILISGLEVAIAVRQMALGSGTSVRELIFSIDKGYESRLRDRNPEQIL